MPRTVVRWARSMAAPGFTELLVHNEPVLVAGLVAAGTSSARLGAALGLGVVGFGRHRYAAGVHSAPAAEVDALEAAIAGLGADAASAESVVARAQSAGEALLAACRLAAGQADQLDAALAAVASGVEEVAPFVIAAPALSRALARTAGGSAPAWEPEIAREVRDCFALAAAVARRPDARELVCNRAPRFAMPLIEQQAPDVAVLINRHVEEYAWLGTHGGAGEPMTPRMVIERLQKILLRFPGEVIEEGGAPPPAGAGGAREAVLGRRVFRPDALVQALVVVRPLLDRVAQALGCTRGQLEACSAEEIGAGLLGEAPLPVAEADRRIGNGFVVERVARDVRITAEGAPVVVRPGGYRPAVVAGQSVALGRAVGRVRILSEAVEVADLRWGDVVVTAASTPDRMGVESAFPERGGAPSGIERAAAIVADEGGLLSHAAILSRELGIPCVLGTETATTTLRDGQWVEVDATKERGTVIPFDA